MIKQTMAVLLLSTGLASVAQAQYNPDLTGILLNGAQIDRVQDHSTGICQVVQGGNIRAVSANSRCSATTWTQAAAHSSSTVITGFNHGSTLVSQGQAGPPMQVHPGNTGATDIDGDTFDYAIWNALPAGSTSRGTLNVPGNLRTSDDVNGNGYYMRSDGRFNLVSNWQRYSPPPATSSADYTGVAVFGFSGEGGLLDTSGQFATIEPTSTGRNCFIRTVVRPLQASGQRHQATMPCSSYTWDSLDASSFYTVTGVPAGQGGRPILEGIVTPVRTHAGLSATQEDGSSFTYDIYNYRPAAATRITSEISIEYNGGNRRILTGEVTGEGYYVYPQNTGTTHAYYHVTGFTPPAVDPEAEAIAAENAILAEVDYTGITVDLYMDGTYPLAEVSLVEQAGTSYCHLRLDGSSSRINIPADSCIGLTWQRAVGGTVTGIDGVELSSTLEAPVLTNANPTDFGPFNPRQNVQDDDGDTFSYSIWTPNGEPDVTFRDGTLIIEDRTVGQGASAVVTITVQGDVTGDGAYRDTETNNYYRVTGYTADPFDRIDRSGTVLKDNGDQFTYDRYVDHSRMLDVETFNGDIGINVDDNELTRGDVTEVGYYSNTLNNRIYYHVTAYTPSTGPTVDLPDTVSASGTVTKANGDVFTYDRYLASNGQFDNQPQGTGISIRESDSVVTVGDVTETGYYVNFFNTRLSYYHVTSYTLAADVVVDPHAAYLDRTSAAVAVGDFDWDNNLIITVSDGLLRVPTDNADNLCELDGGSGTYVIQAGSCSVATWADALAQGEVGMQNRALRGVPVNWLELTIASTLPGAAPIVEDPADTLSDWSAWTEVEGTREATGESVEVSMSYKGKTLTGTVEEFTADFQRTRTVIINGDEDDTPPEGDLVEIEEDRTITPDAGAERAALLAALKAQYAAANEALKKQLESDIDYGTKLTANLKNGDKFVLNLTTVGIEYHRTYDIVKDGNTFHITPRVVAGGFIGGDANYIGGGADINVEIKAIKEALVKVGFDTGTYFKYWAGERDGFDELSGTGLTATRFYLDATKDYKGVTYNARVATDGVVHVEARKDKFTLGANTEGQLKVGYKTDFDTSTLDAPINDSVAAVKTSSKKVFAKILGLFGRD